MLFERLPASQVTRPPLDHHSGQQSPQQEHGNGQKLAVGSTATRIHPLEVHQAASPPLHGVQEMP